MRIVCAKIGRTCVKLWGGYRCDCTLGPKRKSTVWSSFIKKIGNKLKNLKWKVNRLPGL